MNDGAERFFAYARERHATYLRRQAGGSRPFSQDPILQEWRFCNVFRELDRTTIWFRENIREPLRGSPNVLLATVLFRWFNRITSGEAIFKQPFLDGHTAWETYLYEGDSSIIRQALIQFCGDGPYVTGAYIIKTPDGKDKIDGVLWALDQFNFNKGHVTLHNWHKFAEQSIQRGGTRGIEETVKFLVNYPYLGDFMAYEIATDLRHTAISEHAPDISLWANPGPGATRGLNRVFGRNVKDHVKVPQRIREMHQLLERSRDAKFWPQQEDLLVNGLDETHWPVWEMREVEHTLCEFDKYERVRLGEGTPRNRFT